MNDQKEAGQPAADPTSDPEAMPLAEFLESVAPSQMKTVAPIVREVKYPSGGRYHVYLTPEIRLHCGNQNCGGMRIFRYRKDDGPTVDPRNNSFEFEYMNYICSNCQKTTKTYSLAMQADIKSNSGQCYKFGELPAYGPPTSSRLISLIGPDREMFLRGRRCEIQGLGIGAFVYYRRVVENQKNRILEKIIEVANMQEAPTQTIAALEDAKKEVQFHKAMQSVKDAIPESLKIRGHNPLTLLHSALSDGLHARDDQTCLGLANAIRVVLAELSDRIGQTLNDTRELNSAISLLMKRGDI